MHGGTDPESEGRCSSAHGAIEEPDSFRSVLADVLGLGTHLCLCVMLFPSATFRNYSMKGQAGTLHPQIFDIKIEMLSSLQAFNSLLKMLFLGSLLTEY